MTAARSMRADREYRYLKPGELLCPDRPCVVSTVLGSCVAVTFFAPHLSLGCICHAVLPASRGDQDVRYADRAISYMLLHFERLGVQRREIEVKLFGGADTLPTAAAQTGLPQQQSTVGRQNIEAALAMIAREGLRVAASDVGGLAGRKLLFYSHTGEIFLKRFPIRDTAA